MKEPFDKKLAKKIRDSFEANEEPFDPIEWDKFSRSYFGKPRRNITTWLFWAGSVAASLLLFALLWNPFQSIEDSNDLANPLAYNEGKSVDATEFKTETQEPLESGDQKTLVQSSLRTPEKTSEVRSIQTKPAQRTNTSSRDLTTQSLELIALSKVLDKEMTAETEKETPLPLAAAEIYSTTPQESASVTPHQTEEAQQKINSWLAEAGSEEDRDPMEDKSKNPLKLGAFVAPQNISNSTQNVNFGAGLMSEISFSKRLRLDVGIGYAKQNLVPEQSFRRGALEADIASSERAKASSFAGNYINSTSELSFGQVEIPLNMKYAVLRKKTSDLYLISGLSNMFYLNQVKTTTYNSVVFAANTMSAGVQTLNATSQSESPSTSGGQVDVGQLINLGFGFEQHLKNGTSLSFEPFYKFTLNDQTFVDQRFAIAGINLRMNFQLKK